MQFRIRALSELRDPSGLDRPRTFAQMRSALILVPVLSLMAIFGVWSYAGRLTRTIEAKGVIVSAEPPIRVVSTVSGYVSSVPTRVNQTVSSGQGVVVVNTSDGGSTTISAPSSGRVVSLVAPGTAVSPGQPVVTMESTLAPTVALVFVSPSSLVAIQPGEQVRLTLDGYPPNVFGRVVGTVSTLDPFDEADGELENLIDIDLVDPSLLGNHLQVLTIEIESNPNSPSGMVWDGGDGPGAAVPTYTTVDAQIEVDQTRPVDLVLNR